MQVDLSQARMLSGHGDRDSSGWRSLSENRRPWICRGLMQPTQGGKLARQPIFGPRDLRLKSGCKVYRVSYLSKDVAWR